jgi:hypothetical protein
MPPGFLGATAASAHAGITQCAERIYYRLSMWARDPAQRSKSPMPPAQSLRATGHTVSEWRSGPELAGLLQIARDLLDTADVDSGKLLAGRYLDTRPCLKPRIVDTQAYRRKSDESG